MSEVHKGVAGYSTTLSYKSGSYTALGYVASITTNITQAATPVPHLTQAGNVIPKIRGSIDSGQVSCTIVYEETQYSTLLGLMNQDLEWRITYPDGDYEDFDGFVTALGAEVPGPGDAIMCPMTIERTGNVTLNSGTTTTTTSPTE